jgi:methanogenic corrinoid protein MtbC1
MHSRANCTARTALHPAAPCGERTQRLNTLAMSPARFAASLLRPAARTCAIAALERIAARTPRLLRHGVPATFADPVDDTTARVRALAESLDVDRPELFADHVAWYKVALAYRGVDADYLPASVLAIGEAVAASLPAGVHAVVERHCAAARDAAERAPAVLPSLLDGDGPLRDEARRFVLALLENRRDDAIALVLAAHRSGATIAALHDHVLALAQREIGRMWLMAEVPIADEHFASRVVEACLDRLEALRPPTPPEAPTVVTCAVGGDQHAIALRLVAERFALAGFRAWHLGADMPASDLEWMLQDRRADVLALGVTMLLHVGAARAAIERLRAALGPACPVLLVGGRPFEVAPDLHVVIGADGTAAHADGAVARARELLAARS